MADTHLVDWLEVKGFDVDIITDGDLHTEGPELLERYNVVLTGTHPEYYSWEMLQGMRTYLEQGGRLMYMGGNGFYWIAPIDPTGTYIELRRRDGTNAWHAAPGESYHKHYRRVGRAMAVSGACAPMAGRRGVHRPGVRPQLAVPADAGQLRPSGVLYLRGDR